MSLSSIKQIDELQHIDVGNARHEVDAGFFQSCENLLRSRDGSHIANASKVRSARYTCRVGLL